MLNIYETINYNYSVDTLMFDFRFVSFGSGLQSSSTNKQICE